MKYLKSIFYTLILLFFSSINFITFAEGDDPDCYARIMLVGNYCCGKTAIHGMLFGSEFDPNIGASDMMCAKTAQRELKDGRIVQFNIWDTAGADKYYNQVIKFLDGANFVVIVHDLSSEYTEQTEKYMEKLLVDVQGKMRSDGKIIIVGSKWDRRNEKPVNFSKHKALLDNLNSAHKYHVFYSAANDKLLAPQVRAKILSYIKEKCEVMKLYDKNPDSKLFKDFEPGKQHSIGRICAIL